MVESLLTGVPVSAAPTTTPNYRLSERYVPTCVAIQIRNIVSNHSNHNGNTNNLSGNKTGEYNPALIVLLEVACST